MASNYVFSDSLPIAPLKIVALKSCQEPTSEVNDHVVQFRRNDMEELMCRKGSLHHYGHDMDSYLLPCNCPRFDVEEGETAISESVHSTDVFVIVDVMNYSTPYMVSGYTNHMSPDDRFQNLKRVIGACVSTIHRVNIIMPLLYKSRQHKRSERESLDCAMEFEGLAAMGVENIITLDVHDPRVQDAISLTGSDDFMPTYQFVKNLFMYGSSIQIDKEYLMITSPNERAMNRIIYLANNLGVDIGMFYKRRDYSQTISGHNPIVIHEFLGTSAEGKAVPIIDNMVSSDKSMLDTCKELKERKTGKVIICCTFGLFISGLEKLDEFYTQGYLDYAITTNLNYHNQDPLEGGWYLEANTNKYTAVVINALNHDRSISTSLSPTEKIQKLVQKCQNGGYKYFQKLV